MTENQLFLMITFLRKIIQCKFTKQIVTSVSIVVLRRSNNLSGIIRDKRDFGDIMAEIQFLGYE